MNSKLDSQKIPVRLQIFVLLVLLLTAYFSEGFHRGDEHYQLLEFTNYILGRSAANDLCWEFGAQIRPSIQPYIAVGVIKFLNLIGFSNPHTWAFALRVITALLSFLVMRETYLFFMSKVKRREMLFYLMTLLWFVVYVSVRFSSETWSALFFMFAMFLYFRKKSAFFLILAGALAGLSFEFRYQTAIMSLGFFMWLILIEKVKLKSLLLILLGFLSAVGLCTLLDTAFYGEFVFAPYNYFYVNLIEDKVSSFGVDPWYHYIPDLFNKTYTVYGVFILVGMLFLLYKNPKSVVNFVVLPFVLFHFMVGHKEMRFLYPVIYFAPFFIAYGVESLLELLSSRIGAVFYKALKVGHFILASFLLICTVFYSFKSFVKVRGYMARNATSKDVLYVIEDNPYDRKGLPFNFYNIENQVEVIEISAPDEIKVSGEDVNIFLYTSIKDNDRKYEIPENASLIFQSLPVLLTSGLNINNWVGRTTIDRLFKIQNKSK